MRLNGAPPSSVLGTSDGGREDAGLLDSRLEPVDSLTPGLIRAFVALNLSGVGLAVVLIARDFLRRLRAAQEELEDEKKKSDALLLNVLPEPIAER